MTLRYIYQAPGRFFAIICPDFAVLRCRAMKQKLVTLDRKRHWDLETSIVNRDYG